MRNTLFVLWPRVRHPAVLRYGASVLIVATAFAVRVALDSLASQSPMLLFIPAVFLAALLFGGRAGILATVLSALLATAYTLGADLLHGPLGPALVALFLFVAIGLLIAFITDKLHATMRQLTDSEAEKSLLLEELAHRTRNDLMLVSSALSLQARTTTDPMAQNTLEAAVNRIGVIAKAQERLGTRAGHRGFVELGAYLKALCGGLGELLRDVRPIAVRVVAPELEVPSNQAVGVGLIVNELVTNALKHAFPGDRGGVVTVHVEKLGKGLRLVIEDDGIGCPTDARSGLGSRLVQMLAAQYDGIFERQAKDPGCRACVTLRSIEIAR